MPRPAPVALALGLLVAVAPSAAEASTLDLPDTFCPTAALWELQAQADELTPAQRHELDLLTSPFYRARLARGEASWLESEPTDGAARETCFEPEDIVLEGVGSDFGPYDGVVESEHFVLHFDPDTTSTSRANLELQRFEAAYEVEVNDWGFDPPPGAPGNQILVFVDPLPAGFLGLTALWSCGANLMPYVILSEAFMEEEAEDGAFMAPHELFHAVQVGYWFNEMYIEGPSPEAWLVESTATYASDGVAELGSAWNARQYAPALAGRPDRGLRDLTDAVSPYSAYLHWLAADRQLGDASWLADYFDAIRDGVGWNHLEVWEEVLNRHDSSVADSMADYLGRLGGGDWGFEALEAIRPGLNQNAPLLVGTPNGLSAYHPSTDLPLVETITDGPMALGAGFVRLHLDDLRGGLRIELSGEGDAVEQWVFTMLAFEDEQLQHRFSPLSEDGVSAVGLLSGVEEFDQLIVGVLPIGTFEGPTQWSYRIRRATAAAEPGFTDAAGSGCACSGGPTAEGGALPLFLVALLALARRETAVALSGKAARR